VTPAALVAELRARGVTLRPDGDALRVRPVSKVKPEELEALRQYKPEVLALLVRELSRPVPDSSRTSTFRSQLEAWIQSGRVGVPLLVLPDAPPPTEGRCISCGVALASDQTWRCPACLEAVKAALAEGRA
jgi:tubulysin polyketide synthase-like protein